ncbi:MAG TPA: energy transducer TonB [Longimicrobium sp.]|nr:energy transducer TonB [Longimicrobium sp.]
MRHVLAFFALAAGGLTFAPPASAQETGDAPSVPTCASQGLQRVAVMVPPGQTAERLQETLRHGGLFPAGTQVLILEPGQLMPIRNREQFDARLRTTLTLVLDHGMHIQGTAWMLVEVDDDGTVRAVHPNSGDPELNRMLVRTWRLARFEPYVFDGCRVRAWIQVPQTFTSDFTLDRREIEVRTAPPKP